MPDARSQLHARFSLGEQVSTGPASSCCRYATVILMIAGLMMGLSGCGPDKRSPDPAPLNEKASVSARSFQACVDTVRKLNADDQVRADFARGETRYFFVDGWERMWRYAPGISACSPSKKKPDGDKRPIRAAGFDRPKDDGAQGKELECEFAISNCIVAYNRSMARSYPKTLRDNCDSPKATVDDAYPSFDFDAYYKRMAGSMAK